MSVSSSPPVRRRHTVLGGGPRYETAELLLPTIANFDLKQKGRLLELFSENHVDSLLAQNGADVESAETFAFESQAVHHDEPMALDLSAKHVDSSIVENDESINNISSLATPAENQDETISTDRSNTNTNRQRKSSWTSAKDPSHIKKETISPKIKQRRSNKKPSSSSISKGSNSRQQNLSSVPSLRQMTMTQLFDPPELPPPSRPQPIAQKSKTKQKETRPIVSTIKREPESPTIDAMMFMPESLIGLAQPYEQTQEEIPIARHTDADVDQQNNESNITTRAADEISSESPCLNTNRHLLKRKMSISPVREIDPIQQTPLRSDHIHEAENEHNRAVLESPYAGIEAEELLYACPMCRNYWLGLPEELRHKEGLTCRHRQRPVVRTPEHFWSLGIPSTQTCIQRGYGGVLPPENPVDRPRRPRRQHQRMLQEQQQKDDESEEEEDEEVPID